MSVHRLASALLTLASASFLAALAPSDLCANVLPEAAILFHVDPSGGASCDLDLTDCHDVTRYTDATGAVVFAAFVYPRAYVDDHLAISSLQGTVTWPDTWTVLEWIPCGTAEGSFTPLGNSGELELSWPDHPAMQEDLLLAAMFVVQASGYGEFDIGLTELELGWPEPFTVQAWGADAQAGVECSYCATPCGRNEYCVAAFDPQSLEFELNPGEISVEEVIVEAWSAAGPPVPCQLDCTCTEAWMSTALEELEWPYFRLEVTVDATDLFEGLHEGWVRVAGGCVRCLDVDLVVRSPSDAPEPPDDTDAQVTEESWGRIKTEFR